MQQHPTITATAELSATDRADVLLGRADWTWPDYVAAGERWYDEQPRHPRWTVPTSRRTCARAWAELNCPPAKRAAWSAQKRVAAEMPAGVDPYGFADELADWWGAAL